MIECDDCRAANSGILDEIGKQGSQMRGQNQAKSGSISQ
jgi:hypothetical protein